MPQGFFYVASDLVEDLIPPSVWKIDATVADWQKWAGRNIDLMSAPLPFTAILMQPPYRLGFTVQHPDLDSI